MKASLPDPKVRSALFAPIQVIEVELSEPLPHLEAESAESGHTYAAALCLVRLHGSPLGSVRAEIPPGGLEPGQLAGEVQNSLEEEIDRHLLADGREPAEPLGATGIRSEARPPCLTPLEELLQRAPTVSVVIPTRNRPSSLLETLASILRSNYPADRYEVIVVDNGSGADQRADLSGIGHPEDVEIRLLQEPCPGGANARNRGLGAAGGEIVAFCDDDVLVDRNWIANLALAFDSGERVGGVAGLTLPREL